MMWGDILSAAGAGLKGGLDAYTWQQDYNQRDRQIDNRAEIARLNNEVRELIARMNNSTKMEIHETPSGSVVAQQEGANARNAATNETRTAIAEMNADVQRNNESGRNRRFEQGITSRGIWEQLRDSTRRRGQDISSATQRRGQDLNFDAAEMRNETTRRGQDLGAAGATMRDATTRRGQDLRGAGGAGSSGLPPVDAPAPTAPAPAPAAVGGDDPQALAIELRAALDAYKAAKKPADKAAARQKVAELRARVKQ